MPKLFAIKRSIDAALNYLPRFSFPLTDFFMQCLTRCWPQHLPNKMLVFRDRYEHHLLLKMSDQGIVEAQAYLNRYFSGSTNDPNETRKGSFFLCTEEESKSAYLHRFGAAGAAIRYQMMHRNKVGEVLALDIALKRNEQHWFEELPQAIAQHIEHSLYYGHFLCHVFHQDYILKKGSDSEQVKGAMLKVLKKRGAKYPAEHNVGHMYQAEPEMEKFYQGLDPVNMFNPGIGLSSKKKYYCSDT